MSGEPSSSRRSVRPAPAPRATRKPSQAGTTGLQGAHRKLDARVHHTREILGDALVALIHEKPFDSITVQQVLDRAHVSRSTFYAHYSDKNDLFFSDAEEFFEAASRALSKRKERSNRVAPVREFFEHVADFHKFHAALVTSGKIQDILELAQGHFARGIEQRLREIAGVRPMTNTQRALLAHFFAGALMSLLNWWIHRSDSVSAAEMDEQFHQMVWSGVGAPTAQKPGLSRIASR